jgi:cold shock CspA family protein
MLKTIRNYVLERRDVHRRRRQILEEDDMREPLDACEAPPQPAEPQLGERPVPTIWGKLKRYDPAKRYGFVDLSDGSGGAFLHAASLVDTSVGTLLPGVRIQTR